MTTVKMSLHRIISEIKTMKASGVSMGDHFVVVADNKGQTVLGDKQRASAQIQSNIDQTISDFNKLVALKAARNLANATTKLNFQGEEVTIDQVLAKRDSLFLLEGMLQVHDHQFTRCQNQVNEQNQKIASLINQQIEALAGKNNKLQDAEIDIVRDNITRTHVIELVIAPNQSEIERARKLIKDIKSELDYALVEVNAKTEVEVSW